MQVRIFLCHRERRSANTNKAFWANDPPESTVTPIALRAPELIFKESFNSSIDIWSFGCLIYEILTGVQLFNVYSIGGEFKDEADDDHLLDLNDVIEPLPDSWLSKWPRSHKYFGPNRERMMPESVVYGHTAEDFIRANGYDMEFDEAYGKDEAYPDHTDDEPVDEKNAEENDNISDVDGGLADEPVEDENAEENDKIPVVDGGLADDTTLFISDSLEVQFEKNKPDDIDSEEAKVITELIRKILRYEPSERPTAADLLQHSWFKD